MAKKKNTVWVVTTGTYSSYSVEAICSTKEIAKQVAAMCSDANEPFPLEIDALADKAAKGLKLYLCWCRREDANIEPSLFSPTWKVTPPLESKDGHMLRVWAWASDAEHACKIANEKRSLWLTGNLKTVKQ